MLTHWWDGSQIYGESEELTQLRRSHVDGKLKVNDDGSLPWPTNPDYDPSQVPGFWLGLAMLITLFTLRAQRDLRPAARRRTPAGATRSCSSGPGWSTPRCWPRSTPSSGPRPSSATRRPSSALRANWFGLAGERVHKLFGRISGSEVVSGIPGAETDHYGVPYSLTEEFVAVYRMHPLIRDDWSLRRLRDDSTIRDCTLRRAHRARGARGA